MNILLFPSTWFGCGYTAGGEVYLLRLAKYLQSQGHNIRVFANCKSPYSIYDMDVFPMPQMQNIYNDGNELCQWADLFITQLNGTSGAYNKARQHGKQLVFIAHNTATSYVVQYMPTTQVIYNSNYVKSVVNPKWQLPNIVIPPAVDYREYNRTTNGKYITLVNCNELKGGHVLVALAESMPDFQFLGVKGGYGTQITADLPNLRYIENGSMDMREVYANTWCLIQPSHTETYGQAVLEAMCCGIPVIVSDTTGLRECVSDGGQYADRNNLQEYREKILNLVATHKEWSDKAYNRAKELEPSGNLRRVEGWLKEIIQK